MFQMKCNLPAWAIRISFSATRFQWCLSAANMSADWKYKSLFLPIPAISPALSANDESVHYPKLKLAADRFSLWSIPPNIRSQTRIWGSSQSTKTDLRNPDSAIQTLISVCLSPATGESPRPQIATLLLPPDSAKSRFHHRKIIQSNRLLLKRIIPPTLLF